MDRTQFPLREQPAVSSILVWDLPVRFGHWMMAAGFVLAWLTAKGHGLKRVHVAAGALVFATVVFRLVWGRVGSRYARFSEFVRGPGAALDYLKSLRLGTSQPTIGHNPAGGLAIVTMLVLVLAAGTSGWLCFNKIGGHGLKTVHDFVVHALLAFVFLHLAGVFVGTRVHGENLVRSMVTGKKQGPSGLDIGSAHPRAALALLGWVAFLVWWVAR